jgi:hypothetical protein
MNDLSKFELCTPLMGGFGNQLFMIFNLIALSKEYNKKIKFYYDEIYINKCLRKGKTLRKSSSCYEIFKNIDFTDIDYKVLSFYRDYNELEFKYNKIILEREIKYIIKGYFQSYKYFWEYKDDIKEYLYINWDKIKEIRDNLRVYKKPILSIHMRLGDYLQSQDYHSIPLLEYFKDALGNYNVDDYQMILLSDDIEGASERMKELNVSFIKGDELYRNDEEQFYMLCLSKIRVCSNSTYSLMSCYINDMYNFVEDPEYIFPNKWFGCARKTKFNYNNFVEKLNMCQQSVDTNERRKCIVKSIDTDLFCVHDAVTFTGKELIVLPSQNYLRHYRILSSKQRGCECSIYCVCIDHLKTVY